MSKLDLEELPVESPKTIESSSNKQEGAKIPKGYMDAMCSPDGVLNDKIRQEFLDNLRKIKFTAPTPYRPFDESIFTDPQCAPFKIFFETLYKPEYTDIGIDELMKKLTILDENGALVEYNGKEMLRILRSTTLDTCTDQDKVILILLNLYVGEYPMESKKQGLKLLEAVINNADI